MPWLDLDGPGLDHQLISQQAETTRLMSVSHTCLEVLAAPAWSFAPTRTDTDDSGRKRWTLARDIWPVTLIEHVVRTKRPTTSSS